MNFLKKLLGKKDTYQNSNRLEDLLKLAATDPAYRPDFYRQIFHHKLYVLGKINPDNSLSLINRNIDGEVYTYAYTSLESIKYVLRNKSEGLPYVEISSFDLFSILSDSGFGLILNNEMDYGRMFISQELKQILSDERSGAEAHHVEKGSEISIGIPRNIPEGLVKVFQSLIKKTTGVKDIYFGLQLINGEPSYLAVIDVNDDDPQKMQDLFKDIGIILNEIKLEYPLDMTVANDRYRNNFQQGSLISCLNYQVV